MSRTRRVVRQFAPYGRLHRAWLGGGLVAAVGVVTCRLAFPWPLRGIMEMLFQGSGGQRGGGQGVDPDVAGRLPMLGDPIGWLAAGFLLIVLAQGLAEHLERLAFARFAIRMVHDTRAAAVSSLFQWGTTSGRRREPGDLLARIIGDSARVKAAVKSVLAHVAQDGLLGVGVCAVLLVVDLQLGLVYLAGVTAAAAIAVLGAARVGRVARRHRRKEGVFAVKIHRALLAAATRNGSKRAAKRFAQINRASGRDDAQITTMEGLTSWLIHGVLGASACVILVVGLQRVGAGTLEPGALFTFVAYILMVHNPLVQLARQLTRLGPLLASAERLVGAFRRRRKTVRAGKKTRTDSAATVPAATVPEAGRSASPRAAVVAQTELLAPVGVAT